MTSNAEKLKALGIDFSFLDKLADPAVRVQVRQEFLGWCLIYLRHYFTLTPADFHGKLIKELTSEEVEMLLVIGFRGSAKSVFCSLAFPLFCALENKYKFIVVINDTGTQMKMNIANIKYELETNEMILKDYGITFDPNTNWSDSSLLLLNDTFILGRSRGQKIRGLRHRQWRPQVIIIDDAEDTEWVKKKINRDKTEAWFNSEVVPAQQEDKFKLIVIGNLLHKNALMTRLKKKRRADGTRLFKCLQFPLINKLGHCTWRGKYPTEASIQKQKEKIGSETAWAREYLLKIISDKDAVIKETDIHRYDNAMLTAIDDRGRKTLRIKDAGVGNDLAISEEDSADFTAFVGGYKVLLYNRDKDRDQEHILILPDPTNKRMDFDGTLKEALVIEKRMPSGVKFYVEDVQYQKSALQTYKKNGISVHPMRPVTDKKARLQAVAPYIKDGTVLFPQHGCEELLEQLIGFGSEEHDDLVDALVYLLLALVNKSRTKVVGKVDQM